MSATPVSVAAAPGSTYRLQLHPGFTFDDAAAVVPYLHDLGIGAVYLSPVLQAAPGSMHGYDVVDHGRLSAEAGGSHAFERLSAAARRAGLRMVADVVPNHMAVPVPVSLNAALWAVLRDGPAAPTAGWFDVDWSVAGHALLMPVLGSRIGQVLAAGELRLDTADGEPVLRYFDHAFPVRPGTEHLPLTELVDRQWYRLAHWRVADEELNYRRFFDVDTLAAVRVEDPEVFASTHDLLARLVRAGDLHGLRIDHPDGLADPSAYLSRLAEVTGGAWVVVEKILEGDERLPADWVCAGTTGYDALNRVCGLFVDPAGAGPLTALWTDLSGSTDGGHAVVERAKRDVVENSLYAEVDRLVELAAGICTDDVALRDHPRRGLRECIVEMLVAFDRYRAYVVPGREPDAVTVEAVRRAASIARSHLPEDRFDTLDLMRELVLGRPVGSHPEDPRRAELVIRFQQTCGPVMAKGVEDTAFYRWFRLASLNEVGADPERFGVSTDDWHAWCVRQLRQHPDAMTSLSTHDTKRSEDVRARLAVVSELAAEWAEAVPAWRRLAERHRDAPLDPETEYLVWQTVVGTWDAGPLAEERLVAYLHKAVREAKLRTTWTSPDKQYEDAVARFAHGVLTDVDVLADLEVWASRTAGAYRANVLGAKLVQLTAPGVPDTYQGCELVDLSLVDPDNRRPVDYAARRSRLARLDAGGAPRDLDDEKLLVTSRALRLRRDHPAVFLGGAASYEPVQTSSGNLVAFARGGSAVTLATRCSVSLERRGGWGDSTVQLPAGTWRDTLTGRTAEGGTVALADLLVDLPVALLTRP